MEAGEVQRQADVAQCTLNAQLTDRGKKGLKKLDTSSRKQPKKLKMLTMIP